MTVDASGEVVSVTVSSPRFTPREKALLLASRRDERAPRGRHGLLLSDATNPDARFVVDAPTRDFAQQVLDREQDAYEKQYGDTADMKSLLWRVRKA